jgi:hypothetical protein
MRSDLEPHDSVVDCDAKRTVTVTHADGPKRTDALEVE